MAWGFRLVNFEKMFATSSRPPIIANDFDISSDDAREELSKLLYTHYEGDTLGVLPQCQCGNLRGVYLIGKQCDDCGTDVEYVTEKQLEPFLWVAPPTGVKTLMNPQAWTILSKALTYGQLNILEYLCNPLLQLPPLTPKETQRFLQLKIPRGINYFYEHFDDIMASLFEYNLVMANADRSRKEQLRLFLEMYREEIFTRYLPCPSRISLVTEKTVTASYAEPTMPLIVDAVLTITSTENSTRPLSIEVRQARATEALKKIAEYHQEVQQNVIYKKEGWSRRQVFGTRLHWTFRGVITSMSDNHVRDELHMPWSMSVLLLQIHLFNKLLKLNYTPNEAYNLVEESVLQYNPLIDRLFDELIQESPVHGICCLLGRNPTLERGLRGELQSEQFPLWVRQSVMAG